MKSFLHIAVLLFFFSFTVSGQQGENTVTMKEYIDKQVDMLLKISDIRYDNIESNVRTANSAMDKRMDGVNEFRAQLKDQVATFPTRKELWGYLVAVITTMIAIMNFLQKKKETEKTKAHE